MKRKIFAILVLTAFLAIPALAFSDTLVDYYAGSNDTDWKNNPSILESILETWLTDNYDPMDLDLDFYAKVEEDDTTTTEGSGSLTLTYLSVMSGTWSSAAPIVAYTVKAGNGDDPENGQYSIALYWVDGGNSGDWSTFGLLNNGSQQPGISHFTAWIDNGTGSTDDDDDVNPTPEPGTVVLLGLGLVGLAGYRKYRK